MATVYIYTPTAFEFNLKKFKLMCGREQILSEYTGRQHFESPAAKRKNKDRKAKQRNAKARAKARRS